MYAILIKQNDRWSQFDTKTGVHALAVKVLLQVKESPFVQAAILLKKRS